MAKPIFAVPFGSAVLCVFGVGLARAQDNPHNPPPPIPPQAEARPVPGPGGSYCYEGSHPVDTRVSPGSAWHEANDRHAHFYAPFDMRLFAYQGDCYHFLGDPRDFGYSGSTYSYYGAHPVLDLYGGGWCFMIGGHHHMWRPWSHHFTVIGPWYYWEGAYDGFFWSYYPYYSFYYHNYYPRYYAGGRFAREVSVAPPITHVPAAPSARVPTSTGAVTETWRGTPPGAPGAAMAAPGARNPGVVGDPGWRGVPRGVAPGWQGGSVAPTGDALPIQRALPARPAFGGRGVESWNGVFGGGNGAFGAGNGGATFAPSRAPTPVPQSAPPMPSRGRSTGAFEGSSFPAPHAPVFGRGWRK